MIDKFQIKRFVIIVLIIIVIGAIVFSLYSRETVYVSEDTTNSEQDTRNLCYYRSSQTDNDFYDVAWLKLNITGSDVTGEFQNLPAETDPKIGSFSGTVGESNQASVSRRATVWWDSLAEGMSTKEELIIDFGDGNSTVGFGEMVDRGDGVYVYKDKSNLYYTKPMNQMNCESLGEKLFVEKYVRDNIEFIATDSPVLGGSWYVISVYVNPSTHTGKVIYEDGHIQSKADFTYTYEKNPQTVTITDFEVAE